MTESDREGFYINSIWDQSPCWRQLFLQLFEAGFRVPTYLFGQTFQLLGVICTVFINLFQIEYLKARTDIIITALIVEIELIV
jgi:hypothetical protein